MKASITDTGNGPCFEIECEDGHYFWISDLDGCGMPKEGDWAFGYYSPEGELIESKTSED